MSILKQTSSHGKITERVIEGATVLDISHQIFDASVSLYGGHVLTWQPVGQQPVFWLSETARFSEGNAIRGGIPICWPWFGPHQLPNCENLPNHGFARNRHWLLIDALITEKEVRLELLLQGSHFLDNWQNAFEVRQTLTFSEHFEQSLQVKNTGQQGFECGHALHSYFAVSHPENTLIKGLNHEAFDDKITGQQKQQDSLTNCVGPIDRIYYTNESQVIEDTGWQRQIQVASSHSAHWVLWNPGKETAEKMVDVHVGGENEYVCLEAANTQTSMLLPNEQLTFSQKIKVNTL